MEPGPHAVGEGKVVDVALAVQPHGPQLGVVLVGLGIFGEAESDLGIEIGARLDVGGEAIDVVDALNARAPMGGIVLEHRRDLVHSRIEFERGPERVGGAQRAALVWNIRKCHREVAAREPRGGLVEVGFARELEGERMDFRSAGLPQHERVMVALLDAAQIERVAVPGGFHEPQAIDVERAGAVEVAHAERDVARPHHVERRLQIWLNDRHAVGSASPPRKRRGFRRFEAPVLWSFAVDFQISVDMAARWAYCYAPIILGLRASRRPPPYPPPLAGEGRVGEERAGRPRSQGSVGAAHDVEDFGARLCVWQAISPTGERASGPWLAAGWWIFGCGSARASRRSST